MKYNSRINRRRFLNKNKIKIITMGNTLKKNNQPTDLYKDLMISNLNEKIIDLTEKIDFVDDKIHLLEQNTKANLIVISNDIHLLYEKIKKNTK
tara:strand:+ start:247 stop:528 length:282 start_codon:yes stop_codon:yes gene_type:complete